MHHASRWVVRVSMMFNLFRSVFPVFETTVTIFLTKRVVTKFILLPISTTNQRQLLELKTSMFFSPLSAKSFPKRNTIVSNKLWELCPPRTPFSQRISSSSLVNGSACLILTPTPTEMSRI